MIFIRLAHLLLIRDVIISPNNLKDMIQEGPPTAPRLRFCVAEKSRVPRNRNGFTMVEVLVAITLIGIGVTSTVAALTKINAVASSHRNATGAYAMAMNQIDAIQSASPFKPQSQPPPLILTPGDRVDNVAIYQEDPSQALAVVPGTRTTSVRDVSSGGVTIYRATVTVNYTYLNRPYSISMSTLRTSDQ